MVPSTRFTIAVTLTDPDLRSGHTSYQVRSCRDHAPPQFSLPPARRAALARLPARERHEGGWLPLTTCQRGRGDTRSLHMQCMCSAYAVHMRCTCGAVHMRCTCGAHAVHMRCICGAYAVHMRCICGAHAVHLRCTHAQCGLHMRPTHTVCMHIRRTHAACPR